MAHGVLDGAPIGLLWQPAVPTWHGDRSGQIWSRAQLESWIGAGRLRLTLLGVVPGQGVRIGIDRDVDGVLDGDEGLDRYGNGTAGCGLVLDGNSPPTIGNEQFALVCREAPAGAAGVFALSAATGQVSVLGIDVLVDLANR